MNRWKLKQIAIQMIMNWIGEAYHDLECPYFNRFSYPEREMLRFYIHLYGLRVGKLLHYRYKPR